MFDVTAERALVIVEEALSGGPMGTTRMVAADVVRRLDAAGLLAKCSCASGFGHVRDQTCPIHGDRMPAVGSSRG